MVEHRRDLKSIIAKNALTKHMLEIHSNNVDEQAFTMKLISTNKNNLKRYAGEGLNIEEEKKWENYQSTRKQNGVKTEELRG
jgi:hypothetical protein